MIAASVIARVKQRSILRHCEESERSEDDEAISTIGAESYYLIRDVAIYEIASPAANFGRFSQ